MTNTVYEPQLGSVLEEEMLQRHSMDNVEYGQ